MANAIYNGGPVMAIFNAMVDMVYYKSGIYSPTTNKILGVHSVEVVGWGYNPFYKINYWIVKNSWGTAWGM